MTSIKFVILMVCLAASGLVMVVTSGSSQRCPEEDQIPALVNGAKICVPFFYYAELQDDLTG